MFDAEENMSSGLRREDHFRSRYAGNMPVVGGTVVIAFAYDRATSFVIDFLLNDGSRAEWQYASRDDRNFDISRISAVLNKGNN
ncbi:MAG: hypothetical protein EOP56_08205 [Sphingobacteriales bacterium]|nr:MAG: hypothetical protein EOP56_08205 [Sphingobacteriales bacterium]